MITADDVRARAEALGFAACGITDPGPPPHADHLDRWLARGYAGTMRYLHRQARKRKDPRRNVPEAMAQAMRETIAARRAAQASTHPYYWAAFVGEGAWH